MRCTTGASVDSRTGLRRSEADPGTLQLDAGLQWLLGSATVGARVQREQWRVAGQLYRRVQGLAADAVAAFDEGASAYALASLATYRHPDDGATLDARYRSFTGKLRLATAAPWPSVWTAQATMSSERNRQHDRALDNHGLMLRLAWGAGLAPAWERRAGLIAQWLRFAAFDPLLGVQRSDRYTGVDLSLSRRLAGGLQARLEWNHSVFRSRSTAFDNDSDSLGFALTWSS